MRPWCVVIAVSIARLATADPDDLKSAKAAYVEGSNHYDLREYAAAIDAFRRAYALDPKPLVLFDIAQSYRQLHDCDNARTFYRNYLRNEVEADNRAKVEGFIAEMDACVSAQAKPEPVDPSIRHAPAKTVLPVSVSPPSHALRYAGIVTGALGLIAVGAGVYFSVDANSRADEVAQTCAGGCNAADVADADRAGRTSSRNAVIGYVAGGALVAAGASLIGLSLTREDVAVAPTRGGVAIVGTVHF